MYFVSCFLYTLFQCSVSYLSYLHLLCHCIIKVFASNIRVSAPPLSITFYHHMCYSYYHYVSNVPYLFLLCHCINILNVLYQYRSLCTWWSTSFYHLISPCITGCTVSRSSKRKPGLGCCSGWRRAMWTVFSIKFLQILSTIV